MKKVKIEIEFVFFDEMPNKAEITKEQFEEMISHLLTEVTGQCNYVTAKVTDVEGFEFK